MRLAGTNQPFGRAYTKEFGAWLVENPEFGDGPTGIGKVARSNLMKCLAARVEIEAWRETLPMHSRLTWNHPNTMLRHFEASQKERVAKTKRQPKEGADLKAEIEALRAENERLKTQVEKLQRQKAAPGGPSPEQEAALARVGAINIELEKKMRAAESDRKKLANENVRQAQELEKLRMLMEAASITGKDEEIQKLKATNASLRKKIRAQEHGFYTQWRYKAGEYPFTAKEVKTLKAALHPDSSAEWRNKAFVLFSSKEKELAPPPPPPKPEGYREPPGFSSFDLREAFANGEAQQMARRAAKKAGAV
ncbi:MAG: hypothetical protein EKK29_04950 [Hyphomicrobiales bacterium]|nr:MAG: hypothetical protein EKK29_04950 [Hyphomicrobiales bacterium]